MTLFSTINGHRVTTASLRVPYAGLWIADVELDTAVQLSGAATVELGALELRGTVVPEHTGIFGATSVARVIAGAGGWVRSVAAKHYHNDAGVTVATVALDTAQAVGETLDVSGVAGRIIGIDFVRAAGPASRVLEQLLPSTPWWVDYQGTTRTGVRAQIESAANAYELLSFDPRDKIATLALDDPGAVVIGSVLRARLARPLVVRQLDIEVSKGALRAYAWGVEL